MARGTTLIQLLTMLRAGCKLSLAPNLNVQVRDSQVLALQQRQFWLWRDYTWPHLEVKRQFAVQAGQRYYSPPADIDIDRITKVEARWDQRWYPLRGAISNGDYAAYDSDLDTPANHYRTDPVRAWQFHEGEMMELWPIAATNGNPDTLEGYVRVTGTRKLRPLIEDDDVADIDDSLIVDYCVAAYLASKGDKEAQLKLDFINKGYAKMKSGQTPARQFNMFNVHNNNPDRRCNRVPIAIYNKVT